MSKLDISLYSSQVSVRDRKKHDAGGHLLSTTATTPASGLHLSTARYDSAEGASLSTLALDSETTESSEG